MLAPAQRRTFEPAAVAAAPAFKKSPRVHGNQTARHEGERDNAEHDAREVGQEVTREVAPVRVAPVLVVEGVEQVDHAALGCSIARVLGARRAPQHGADAAGAQCREQGRRTRSK